MGLQKSASKYCLYFLAAPSLKQNQRQPCLRCMSNSLVWVPTSCGQQSCCLSLEARQPLQLLAAVTLCGVQSKWSAHRRLVVPAAAQALWWHQVGCWRAGAGLWRCGQGLPARCTEKVCESSGVYVSRPSAHRQGVDSGGSMDQQAGRTWHTCVHQAGRCRMLCHIWPEHACRLPA